MKRAAYVQGAAVTTFVAALFFFLYTLSLGAWLWYFASPMPNADDFDIFLRFANDYVSTHSLSDRLSLLFTPHNEHRVVLNRFIALTQLTFFGEISFRWLIFIGNSAIPASVLLLPLLVAPFAGRQSYGVFLLVALFLFVPIYVEASLWATTALQNFWVMPLVLVALHVGNGETSRARLLALQFGLLASFVQGNGVFVFGSLAVLWFLRRAFSWAAFAGILFAVLCLVLFGSAATEHVSAAQSPRAEPLTYVLYFLSFLGGAFSDTSLATCLLIGLCALASFFLLLFTRRGRDRPGLIAFFVFLFLTAAAQSLARTPLGVEIAYQTPRYAFVSLFVWISFCYAVLLCLSGAAIRSFGALALVSGLIWTALVGADARAESSLRQTMLAESALAWKLFEGGVAFPRPNDGEAILARSEEIGVFRAPASGVDSHDLQCVRADNVPKRPRIPESHGRMEQAFESDAWIWLRGWSFGVRDEQFCLPTHIMLVDPKRPARVAFVPHTRERMDVVRHHQLESLLRSGFSCLIDKSTLEEGEYSVFLQYGKCGFARVLGSRGVSVRR